MGVLEQSLLTLSSRTHRSSVPPPHTLILLIHRCFNGGRYSPERLQGGTVIQCNGVGYVDEDLSEAALFSSSQHSSLCIPIDQNCFCLALNETKAQKRPRLAL